MTGQTAHTARNCYLITREEQCFGLVELQVESRKDELVHSYRFDRKQLFSAGQDIYIPVSVPESLREREFSGQ